MRYLKLYETFIQSGGDTQTQPAPNTSPIQTPGWAPQLPPGKPGQRFKFDEIEETKLFMEVLFAVESKMSDPDFASKFTELVNILDTVDDQNMKYIFDDVYASSSFLEEELHKYNENIDTNKLAKDALFYLATLGVISLAVKLFYMLGSFTFQKLDQAGFSSVGGGVLLVLIYLAFFYKSNKNTIQIEEEEEDVTVKKIQPQKIDPSKERVEYNKQKVDQALKSIMSKFKK
jgi:hypothetical protein